MKWLPFVLFLLLSSPGFGQDWLPAVEGNQYFYVNPDQPLLIEGFRVDSVDLESEHFYLNRRIESCTECIDCTSGNALTYSIDGISILGSDFSLANDTIIISGIDTLSFPLNTEVGEEWQYSSATMNSATLDSVVWQSVFQNMDSVMYISSSDGHQFHLSKEHGFLSFWSVHDGSQYDLLGIRGINVGQFPPGLAEVLGSQAGDITMYYGLFATTPYGETRYMRREILDRTETETTIGLEVHTAITGTNYNGWIGNIYNEFIEWEFYEKSEWENLNLLPGEVFDFGIYNSSPVPFLNGAHPIDTWSNSIVRSQFVAGKPALTFELRFFETSQVTYQISESFFSDLAIEYIVSTEESGEFCSATPNNLREYGLMFGERVGYMFAGLDNAEYGYYELIGSEIDGETIGDVWSVGEVLSVPEPSQENSILAFPNPSNGNFNIRVLPTQEGTFTLTDLNGRIIKQQYLNSGTHTFDLDLAPGIYLLSGSQNEVVKLVVR